MVTNRMPSGEKAMNRSGPMNSGVNWAILNPLGNVRGNLVSLIGLGVGIGVGAEVGVVIGVAVGGGIGVGVGAGSCVPVGAGAEAAVGRDVGSSLGNGVAVGNGELVAATEVGADIGLAVRTAAGGRGGWIVDVGTTEPQADAIPATTVTNPKATNCLSIRSWRRHHSFRPSRRWPTPSPMRPVFGPT